MYRQDSEARKVPVRDREGPDGSSYEPPRRSAPDDAAERLQAFQRAWFRAVALAWSDPEKLDELKRAPARFLATHCGYTLPAIVDLTVGEARDLPAGGAPVGWDGEHEAWRLPRAQLTLFVPPPPVLDEREVAAAELADPEQIILFCC
jgi:ribosomally synthesized peptide (two-chain TOMM family)